MAGKWKAHNRKLKTRLSGSSEWTEFEAQVECRKIVNGLGNIDSERVVLDVPQVGSFENKIGSFYSQDTHEQKDIIVQFRWNASNTHIPVWSQGSPQPQANLGMELVDDFPETDVADERRRRSLAIALSPNTCPLN